MPITQLELFEVLENYNHRRSADAASNVTVIRLRNSKDEVVGIIKNISKRHSIEMSVLDFMLITLDSDGVHLFFDFSQPRMERKIQELVIKYNKRNSALSFSINHDEDPDEHSLSISEIPTDKANELIMEIFFEIKKTALKIKDRKENIVSTKGEHFFISVNLALKEDSVIQTIEEQIAFLTSDIVLSGLQRRAVEDSELTHYFNTQSHQILSSSIEKINSALKFTTSSKKSTVFLPTEKPNYEISRSIKAECKTGRDCSVYVTNTNTGSSIELGVDSSLFFYVNICENSKTLHDNDESNSFFGAICQENHLMYNCSRMGFDISGIPLQLAQSIIKTLSTHAVLSHPQLKNILIEETRRIVNGFNSTEVESFHEEQRDRWTLPSQEHNSLAIETSAKI
jgi:hypothetical protein